jgi:DNA end-binding protein Ku
MVLITLRAGDEVRSADFRSAEGEIDPDMVAIAETIIKRRTGTFDPATLRDRYQDALKELIEAKLKGRAIAAKPVVSYAPVVNLMAALKRSLALETGNPTKPKRKTARDRRKREVYKSGIKMKVEAAARVRGCWAGSRCCGRTRTPR